MLAVEHWSVRSYRRFGFTSLSDLMAVTESRIGRLTCDFTWRPRPDSNWRQKASFEHRCHDGPLLASVSGEQSTSKQSVSTNCEVKACLGRSALVWRFPTGQSNQSAFCVVPSALKLRSEQDLRIP